MSKDSAMPTGGSQFEGLNVQTAQRPLHDPNQLQSQLPPSGPMQSLQTFGRIPQNNVQPNLQQMGYGPGVQAGYIGPPQGQHVQTAQRPQYDPNQLLPQLQQSGTMSSIRTFGRNPEQSVQRNLQQMGYGPGVQAGYIAPPQGQHVQTAQRPLYDPNQLQPQLPQSGPMSSMGTFVRNPDQSVQPNLQQMGYGPGVQANYPAPPQGQHVQTAQRPLQDSNQLQPQLSPSDPLCRQFRP